MLFLTTTLTGLMLVSADVTPGANVPEIQEADGYSAPERDRPEKPLGMRAPIATRLGFDFIPVPTHTLPPIDHVDLIIESDLLLQQGEPLRFAVPRELDITELDGQWTDVPGGRIWQIRIGAVEAENSSVILKQVDMPEGAELRTYIPDMPESVWGPFTDDGPMDDGRIQSMTEPGSDVMVEYFEPDFVMGMGLPFVFEEFMHGYIPIFKDGLAGGSGACHNHATCDSNWNDVGNATALMLFSGSLCSGQLIATTSQDQQPYFITANHCISTQGTASGAQFVFRYERQNCTGSYSNGASTSGSTLVATQSSSDSTLLRINGSIPTGTYWVGWTTDTASTNLDVTCLHHPGGDYMRISYGDINSNPVCGSSTGWFGVRWNDGVTEGGSSGSGAYRSSDQKLMGVLTCGASSCSNTNGLDGYGRFARAYSSGNFDDYLNNGTPDDDLFEDNDTCATATYLTSQTALSDLIVKSKDEDWYRLNLPAGQTVTFDLDFAHANGDIDAQVFTTSCSGELVDEGTSNTNDEQVSASNFGTTIKRVYIRVFLDSGTTNGYDMNISYGDNPDPTGACCANSFCSVVTASDCAAVSGEWEGPDTNCNNDPCIEPLGACCLAGECYQLTESLCGLAGGTFEGEGVECAADTCGTACIADTNGDNVVDGSDLAWVLGNWNNSAGDINGDGTTNGEDLSIVLGYWGDC
jgi:hypothetical protein